MAKQLTNKTAETIAAHAADRSLGFGPRTGKVEMTAEEVLAVATRAAFIALQIAGVLDKASAEQDRQNAVLANHARAREDAHRARR